MEREHLITALTLSSTNDSWIYNAHPHTRLAFASYLAATLLTGKRELNKELNDNEEVLPDLTEDVLREVLENLLDHYSEEIIDSAIKLILEK